MVSSLAVYVDTVVYIILMVSTLAVYVDTVVNILWCPHWLCM